MNNLDVTKFGVQELDSNEMNSIDGGYIGLIALGLSLVGGAYLAGEAAGKA
ncbi:class IIb bacteriocin, lactobin A/cerein 7B family [Sphingobacterium corticibacter]|uniref:class IIb bacteriocin, lactobin A/cerein 7B family n=1 Tax=Sphingobacterium corticibacter TaxID=2171749 RepID=UPI000E310FC3|nr:class IIb bacteriocin, lactobin A/cerein 7B family [Sphingobacterium corticibacter]